MTSTPPGSGAGTVTSTPADSLITGRPGQVTFDSLDPATGEVVGTYPVHDAAAVSAAVVRARAGAAGFWSTLSFAERARRLARWAGVLSRRIGQLAEVVHAETGKPHSDAQLEIVLAIEHIAWAARHAGKVLGPRKTSPGLLMRNHTATVEYQPFGVVGVIGPWNYPVFTPVGSIAYALAAGNAVVYKPSEHTPGTGAWGWPGRSRRWYPKRRCCSWSPGSARPAAHCAGPAWTRSPSPARRPPPRR